VVHLIQLILAKVAETQVVLTLSELTYQHPLPLFVPTRLILDLVHMPETFTPHKRRREHDEPSEARLKRQRSAGFDIPAAFRLTKRALQHLNQENSRTLRQPRKPLTRAHLIELKKKTWEPSLPAAEFLSSCSQEDLKAIRRLARAGGGQDLCDIRGVRNCRRSLVVSADLPCSISDLILFGA
jgi:hypothetical protein